MRAYILENPIQRYEWGSVDGLSETLGIPNPDKAPLAELWMGAHPKAPSIALVEGGRRPLDALIAEDPARFLGASTAERFGGALPFLFKVLSAGAPLSIQAHPSKRKAERGYERENFAGIPLDAPERNYRDANHKPEMTVALSRFEGLCGFRPIEEIIENIGIIAPEQRARYVGRLERSPGRVELSVLFYSMLSTDPEERRTMLARTRAATARLLAEGRIPQARAESFRWIGKLLDLYPDDMGALAPLVLNHLVLEPGQAAYIETGELHAYLSGTALELMANSDNVIRGGLTKKHVDVPELVSVLSFDMGKPEPLTPRRLSAFEELYPSFAPDFQLSRLYVHNDSVELAPEGPEILLCIEGGLELSEDTGSLKLGRGTSVFVGADAGRYRLAGNGIAYRASVPRAVERSNARR